MQQTNFGRLDIMKELYIAPEMEEVLFDSADIITTSATPGTGENETPATPW